MQCFSETKKNWLSAQRSATISHRTYLRMIPFTFNERKHFHSSFSWQWTWTLLLSNKISTNVTQNIRLWMLRFHIFGQRHSSNCGHISMAVLAIRCLALRFPLESLQWKALQASFNSLFILSSFECNQIVSITNTC